MKLYVLLICIIIVYLVEERCLEEMGVLTLVPLLPALELLKKIAEEKSKLKM